MNGLTPYGMMPPTYWDPSVAQIPYVQQSPLAYYQPYNYQMQYPIVLAAPPTPVSKMPVNKLPGPLPFAPLGRTHPESNIVYTSLGIPPQPLAPVSIPQAIIPTPITQAIIPAPIPPPIMPLVLLPSPRINYHRRSSRYPHDRSSLPPISKTKTKRNHERDKDRHSYDDRLIMSYFGRRRDVDPHRYPDRWYY